MRNRTIGAKDDLDYVENVVVRIIFGYIFMVIGIFTFMTIWESMQNTCPNVHGRVCNEPYGVCGEFGTCSCVNLAFSGKSCEISACKNYDPVTGKTCDGHGLCAPDLQYQYMYPACIYNNPSRANSFQGSGGWDDPECVEWMAGVQLRLDGGETLDATTLSAFPKCLCYSSHYGSGCDAQACPQNTALEICSNRGNVTVGRFANGTSGNDGCQCRYPFKFTAVLQYFSNTTLAALTANASEIFEQTYCGRLVAYPNAFYIETDTTATDLAAFACFCDAYSTGIACENEKCPADEFGYSCYGNGAPNYGFGVELNTTRSIVAHASKNHPQIDCHLICKAGTTDCFKRNVCANVTTTCASQGAKSEEACPSTKPYRCRNGECVTLGNWQNGNFETAYLDNVEAVLRRVKCVNDECALGMINGTSLASPLVAFLMYVASPEPNATVTVLYDSYVFNYTTKRGNSTLERFYGVVPVNPLVPPVNWVFLSNVTVTLTRTTDEVYSIEFETFDWHIVWTPIFKIGDSIRLVIATSTTNYLVATVIDTVETLVPFSLDYASTNDKYLVLVNGTFLIPTGAVVDDCIALNADIPRCWWSVNSNFTQIFATRPGDNVVVYLTDSLEIVTDPTTIFTQFETYVSISKGTYSIQPQISDAFFTGGSSAVTTTTISNDPGSTTTSGQLPSTISSFWYVQIPGTDADVRYPFRIVKDPSVVLYDVNTVEMNDMITHSACSPLQDLSYLVSPNVNQSYYNKLWGTQSARRTALTPGEYVVAPFVNQGALTWERGILLANDDEDVSTANTARIYVPYKNFSYSIDPSLVKYITPSEFNNVGFLECPRSYPTRTADGRCSNLIAYELLQNVTCECASSSIVFSTSSSTSTQNQTCACSMGTTVMCTCGETECVCENDDRALELDLFSEMSVRLDSILCLVSNDSAASAVDFYRAPNTTTGIFTISYETVVRSFRIEGLDDCSLTLPTYVVKWWDPRYFDDYVTIPDTVVRCSLQNVTEIYFQNDTRLGGYWYVVRNLTEIVTQNIWATTFTNVYAVTAGASYHASSFPDLEHSPDMAKDFTFTWWESNLTDFTPWLEIRFDSPTVLNYAYLDVRSATYVNEQLNVSIEFPIHLDAIFYDDDDEDYTTDAYNITSRILSSNDTDWYIPIHENRKFKAIRVVSSYRFSVYQFAVFTNQTCVFPSNEVARTTTELFITNELIDVVSNLDSRLTAFGLPLDYDPDSQVCYCTATCASFTSGKCEDALELARQHGLTPENVSEPVWSQTAQEYFLSSFDQAFPPTPPFTSDSPTISPTFSPIVPFPTDAPSTSPSLSPTASPTLTPSASPTSLPTFSPASPPSFSPSRSPTLSPTTPTSSPTAPTPPPVSYVKFSDASLTLFDVVLYFEPSITPSPPNLTDAIVAESLYPLFNATGIRNSSSTLAFLYLYKNTDTAVLPFYQQIGGANSASWNPLNGSYTFSTLQVSFLVVSSWGASPPKPPRTRRLRRRRGERFKMSRWREAPPHSKKRGRRGRSPLHTTTTLHHSKTDAREKKKEWYPTLPLDSTCATGTSCGSNGGPCGPSIRRLGPVPNATCDFTTREREILRTRRARNDTTNTNAYVELRNNFEFTLGFFFNYTGLVMKSYESRCAVPRCKDGTCPENGAPCPTPYYNCPGDGCVEISAYTKFFKCACAQGYNGLACNWHYAVSPVPKLAEFDYAVNDPHRWVYSGQAPPLKMQPGKFPPIFRQNVMSKDVNLMNSGGMPPRSARDVQMKRIRNEAAPFGDPLVTKRYIPPIRQFVYSTCAYAHAGPLGQYLTIEDDVRTRDLRTGEVLEWTTYYGYESETVQYVWENITAYDEFPYPCPNGRCDAGPANCHPVLDSLAAACNFNGRPLADGTCECDSKHMTFLFTQAFTKLKSIPYTWDSRENLTDPVVWGVTNNNWRDYGPRWCLARNCSFDDCSPPYGCFPGTPPHFQDAHVACPVNVITTPQSKSLFKCAPLSCNIGEKTDPLVCSGNGVLMRVDYRDPPEWYCQCGTPTFVNATQTTELRPNGFGGPRCNEYACTDMSRMVFQRYDPFTGKPWRNVYGQILYGKWIGACGATIGPDPDDVTLWTSCCPDNPRLETCAYLPCRLGGVVQCVLADKCVPQNGYPLVYPCNNHGTARRDGTCMCDKSLNTGEGFTVDSETLTNGNNCYKRVECGKSAITGTTCNAFGACNDPKVWTLPVNTNYTNQQAEILVARQGLAVTNASIMTQITGIVGTQAVRLQSATAIALEVAAERRGLESVICVYPNDNCSNPYGMLPYCGAREAIVLPYLKAYKAPFVLPFETGWSYASVLDNFWVSTLPLSRLVYGSDYLVFNSSLAPIPFNRNYTLSIIRLHGFFRLNGTITFTNPATNRSVCPDLVIGQYNASNVPLPRGGDGNEGWEWFTQWCEPEYENVQLSTQPGYFAACTPDPTTEECGEWKRATCADFNGIYHDVNDLYESTRGCTSECCVLIPGGEVFLEEVEALAVNFNGNTLTVDEVEVFGYGSQIQPMVPKLKARLIDGQSGNDKLDNAGAACAEAPDQLFAQRILGADQTYFYAADNWGSPITERNQNSLNSTDAMNACVENGGWLAAARENADDDKNTVMAQVCANAFNPETKQNANTKCRIALYDTHYLSKPNLTDFFQPTCSLYGCWYNRSGFGQWNNGGYYGARIPSDYATPWNSRTPVTPLTYQELTGDLPPTSSPTSAPTPPTPCSASNPCVNSWNDAAAFFSKLNKQTAFTTVQMQNTPGVQDPRAGPTGYIPGWNRNAWVLADNWNPYGPWEFWEPLDWTPPPTSTQPVNANAPQTGCKITFYQSATPSSNDMSGRTFVFGGKSTNPTGPLTFDSTVDPVLANFYVTQPCSAAAGYGYCSPWPCSKTNCATLGNPFYGARAQYQFCPNCGYTSITSTGLYCTPSSAFCNDGSNGPCAPIPTTPNCNVPLCQCCNYPLLGYCGSNLDTFNYEYFGSDILGGYPYSTLWIYNPTSPRDTGKGGIYPPSSVYPSAPAGGTGFASIKIEGACYIDMKWKDSAGATQNTIYYGTSFNAGQIIPLPVPARGRVFSAKLFPMYVATGARWRKIRVTFDAPVNEYKPTNPESNLNREWTMGWKSQPYMCQRIKYEQLGYVDYQGWHDTSTSGYNGGPIQLWTDPNDKPKNEDKRAAQPEPSVFIATVPGNQKFSLANLRTCASMNRPIVQCKHCAVYVPSNWQWSANTYAQHPFPQTATGLDDAGIIVNNFKTGVGQLSRPDYLRLDEMNKTSATEHGYVRQSVMNTMLTYRLELGFSKSWCSTVTTENPGSERYGKFVSRSCDEKLQYVCMLDYTKNVCLPGRNGPGCGTNARFGGYARLNSTGYTEFPLANATAYPVQNAYYEQYVAGTLNLYVDNRQYDYDLGITYWFGRNYASALPNARFYWDHPELMDRPDLVSPQKRNYYDWIDWSLPKHWPYDCGYLTSKKTGITARYCAKTAQFCDADLVIEPVLMNPAIYPRILLPVNDTASIPYQPTCAASIRPVTFVTSDMYGGPTPGFVDQYTVVGIQEDGGVQIQAVQSTIELFNSVKNPIGFIFVDNFTVTGTITLDCLDCSVEMAIFIGPRDPNGVLPTPRIFIHNDTVPSGVDGLSYTVSYNVPSDNASNATVYQILGWVFTNVNYSTVITVTPALVSTPTTIASCSVQRGQIPRYEPPPLVVSNAPENVCIFDEEMRIAYGASQLGVCSCDVQFDGAACDCPAVSSQNGKKTCGGWGATGVVSVDGQIVSTRTPSSERGCFTTPDATRTECKTMDVGRVFYTTLLPELAFNYELVYIQSQTYNEEGYVLLEPSKVQTFTEAEDDATSHAMELASWLNQDELDSYLMTVGIAPLGNFLSMGRVETSAGTDVVWTNRDVSFLKVRFCDDELTLNDYF